jgi:hypothetical protein
MRDMEGSANQPSSPQMQQSVPMARTGCMHRLFWHLKKTKNVKHGCKFVDVVLFPKDRKNLLSNWFADLSLFLYSVYLLGMKSNKTMML